HVAPRANLAVGTKHLDCAPPLVIEIEITPPLRRGLRCLPFTVADQGKLRLTVGDVAEFDQKPGRATVVLRLDGDDVGAVPHQLADVKAIDALPLVAGTDLDTVDPNGEGIVGS